MDNHTFTKWLDRATNGLGDKLRQHLEPAYAGRPYHNIEHIHRMLEFSEPGLADMRHPEAFLLAVAFHDFFYIPGDKDNERKSAEKAEDWIRTNKIQSEKGQTVVRKLIMATKDHKVEPSDMLVVEKAWIIDADLIGFVQDWQQNAELVREEFAFISDEDWAEGRAGFLEEFAKRKPFFYVPAHEAEFGDRARANIQSEIEGMRQKVSPPK